MNSTPSMTSGEPSSGKRGGAGGTKLSLPPQCELQQEHFSLQIKTSEINQLGLSENGIFQKSHGLTNDHMFSFQMAIGGAPHAHASCGHFEAKQQP